jgi:putative ABC transport system ATP-binding protein
MEEILVAKLIATSAKQIGMFLVILAVVSAAIVAFIIYTMTLGKIREIAVLKLIGTRSRTIAGMILQQALGLGFIGFVVGKISSALWAPFFPKYVLLLPATPLRSFVAVMIICAIASTLAIRAALRVDPADGDRRLSGRLRHPHRGLRKRYGEGDTAVDALKEVNMTVAPGEVVGLIGPSGSGKTTLLKCLGAVIEPTAGRMTLGDEVIYDDGWKISDLKALRRDRIGFVFQAPYLIPFLDVTDNIALLPMLAGRPNGAARQRAQELLEALDVGHRARAEPSQLSGGEQQRVAIARALANQPPVILADEPTAPLDSERALAVIRILNRMARQYDTAVIVVTHDEKIIPTFKRIYHIRDGTTQRRPARGGRPVAADLAVVHRLRRRQPVPERLHQVLPAGDHPHQAGRRQAFARRQLRLSRNLPPPRRAKRQVSTGTRKRFPFFF